MNSPWFYTMAVKQTLGSQIPDDLRDGSELSGRDCASDEAKRLRLIGSRGAESLDILDSELKVQDSRNRGVPMRWAEVAGQEIADEVAPSVRRSRRDCQALHSYP